MMDVFEEDEIKSVDYLFMFFNHLLISLSTLLFIRLTVSLPFLLSDEYLMRFENEMGFESKGQLFFSHYGISNFSLVVIIIFILYRLVLNLFDENSNNAKIILRFKDLWLKTMICWGVFFTIFSTIAVLWGA